MNTQHRRPASLVTLFIVPVLLLGGCSATRSEWASRPDRGVRGSLDFLTAEEIRNYPSATSVEDLLEQHFSGFYIKSLDQRPGATGEVYFLGAASPLFVVDGVPIQYTGSLGLNPRDVESIELVKHGGSAMYGLRGSAGAILITTKRSEGPAAP